MLVSKTSPLKLSNLCCLGLLPFLPLEMLKGSDSETDLGFQDHLDNFFGDYIVAPLAAVLFWPIPGLNMPLVVAWLLGGAIFFTFKLRFVNIRFFKHAIDLIRGKYDTGEQVGEVSHFQALTTALSATVGLGNIAGVAIAIGTGGPGATFWMIIAIFCILEHDKCVEFL